LMNRLYILFFSIAIIGCSADDYTTPISQATVDTDNESDFEEVLIDVEITTIDPATQEIRYVLLDSIYDIAVGINGEDWGVFDEKTGPVDPNAVGVSQVNGFYVQSEPYTHHLTLNYNAASSDLQTAGEAANFLRGFLLPGDYFFKLNELKINNIVNEARTIKPSDTQLLSIEPKERSVFVGKFNIAI
jgi:hypothetical protein